MARIEGSILEKSIGVTMPGFYYGWVIVGLSALANALAWSVRSTFALYYVSLLEEFGWQRGEAAVGYSLSWLLILVFAPLAGRLSDAYGPRVVVPIGGMLLGAGLALTGRAQTLWEYYFYFGVLGAAGVAFMMTPATAVIGAWFTRSRGMAMGIIAAGASSSAVIFYPLNAWLISILGWRRAIATFGAIVALGIGPLAALFYRQRPEDVDPNSCSGAKEAMEKPSRAPQPRAESSVFPDVTLWAAMRTVPLWATFFMWLLGVIAYQIVTTHQMAHVLDMGLDPGTAVWIFGMAGVFTTAGNILGGILSDRLGREWVFGLGSILAVAGIALFSSLSGPSDISQLIIFAVVFGIGYGLRISQLAVIPADLFYGRNFGAIFGFINGGGGIGGFIGPPFAGFLFDSTGSYRFPFAVSAFAVIGSAVAVWIAAPRKARRARNTMEKGT